MMHSLLLRIAISIIIVMSSIHLFGDTFLVGWFTYIAYSIVDALVKHYLREDKDESK
jgi:uncharacterized PurR-regulated membrane protein YhhQ (DUF165 family)